MVTLYLCIVKTPFGENVPSSFLPFLRETVTLLVPLCVVDTKAF